MVPAIVVVIGALVFVTGAGLIPALHRAWWCARDGGWAPRWPLRVGRLRRMPPHARPPRRAVLLAPARGPLGVGVVLGGAAGLLGGLTHGSGPAVLVGLVVATCVFVLVFWRPEVMLLAVAAFPWLDWGARRVLGGFGPGWDDAFLILSIAVLLWCVIVLRRSELWTVPIVLPVLVALVAAVGSVVLRDVPGDVAVFALRVLFQPLLFYFLGFLFPKDKRWVQWVVAVFLVASAALALHGLYQYFTHAPMPAHWVDVREADIARARIPSSGTPTGSGHSC